MRRPLTGGPSTFGKFGINRLLCCNFSQIFKRLIPIVTLKEGKSQTYVTAEYSFCGILRHLVIHRTLGKYELNSDLFEGLHGVNSIFLASAMRKEL